MFVGRPAAIRRNRVAPIHFCRPSLAQSGTPVFAYRRLFAFACVTLALAFAAPASSDTLASLQARALEAQLDRDPVWQRLLSYDPNDVRWFKRSSATSSNFFLSPRGDRDPKAELVATLASFFDPDAVVKDVEHPQCAFIARREYLIDRLGITQGEMPRRTCEHYEAWRRGLAATGATLIYPEGFMNNPASMFGHTLLRIDVEASGEELLGYAVDFTGDAGEDGGLVFIAKGILGLYPGRFGLHPYYQQLRKYAEWENRDIWEYRLDLGEAELDFLLMHLWELRGIDHPYYFFTENCSYHLFRLLELAKPELLARNAMPLTVIPVDTVRETLAVEALVDDIRYRASPATKLRRDLKEMNSDAREIAALIARGETAPDGEAVAALDAPSRARVLDSAYEMLRYSFVQGGLDPSETRVLTRRILIARSKIKQSSLSGSPKPAPVAMPRVRPDQGHESTTARITGGYRDDEAIVDLRFRPAFHGLMDSEGGYPRNMEIRFFDFNLRYFPERKSVRLEEVTLINAVSLSPRSEIFKPVAWSLLVGLATRRVSEDGDLKDAAVARGDMGGGYAYQPLQWLHVYGLATATIDAGPGLSKDVSLGPGARGGFYLRGPDDRFKSHFYADFKAYVAGDRSLLLRAGTEQRLTLSRNTALILDGSYNRTEGQAYLQGGLSLQLHF
jgi:hypothetical protein